jgi:hypothetical protein
MCSLRHRITPRLLSALPQTTRSNAQRLTPRPYPTTTCSIPPQGPNPAPRPRLALVTLAFSGTLHQTGGMEQKVICIPSAYKHGIDEAAIRHVFHTHIKDVLMEGFDNKYITIGFDLAGNLLEVMYNRVNSETIKVFHAMKCRKQFREELNL